MKCIEDEIPFEVPMGWEWCRLSNIVQFINGDRGKNYPSKNDYIENGIPWINTGHILENGTLSTISMLYISEEKYNALNSGKIFQGDLVFCLRGATFGKVARVIPYSYGAIASSLVIIRCISFGFSNYLYYYFCSTLAKEQLHLYDNGSAQPNLVANDVQRFLCPVPPQNELNNIALKIEVLIKVVNTITSNKDSLEKTLALVKSKILDLAIRGKLMPQNPDDEPASILLDRIRSEKETLIKQGKIKRDKKESVIFRGDDNSYYRDDENAIIDISDELPFIIPDSWCWGKLKDIVIINPRNKLSDDTEVSFISMPLIEDGYSGRHTSETRKWEEVKVGFTHFKEGDIGIAKITPCFENKKSTIFKNLCNGYGAGTTELHVLRPYKDTILPEYLLVYVKTNQFIENGKQTFSGAVGQQRIRKAYVENTYFPIPPIKEQYRIVKQLEDLFSYLSTMENALLFV